MTSKLIMGGCPGGTTDASYAEAVRLLEGLRAGSPAETAGFLPGDRFVSVDGRPVETEWTTSITLAVPLEAHDVVVGTGATIDSDGIGTEPGGL